MIEKCGQDGRFHVQGGKKAAGRGDACPPQCHS